MGVAGREMYFPPSDPFKTLIACLPDEIPNALMSGDKMDVIFRGPH